MESYTVTVRRAEWERLLDQATPEERERLIEEWAREERKLRMTVKQMADLIVEEMFG